MAIFSFSVRPLAARKVGPAIAYQSRQVVRLDGDTFRPSKATGLVAEGMAWPRGVGGDMVMGGREALWSAALDAERVRKRGPRCGELRRRAVAGRTAIAALPHELNAAQRLALVRAFADAMTDRYRCAVDFAIHAPDPAGDQRNHHAHLAWTERTVQGDGMGAKVRAFSGPGRAEELRRIRHTWEQCCNRALTRAGVVAHIDARTLAAQGVRRPPGRHVGAATTAISRRDDADFHRIATDLARQVREARARGEEAEALLCWRRLVECCRDAVRAGVASGDALDLAKQVQAAEASASDIGSQRQTMSAGIAQSRATKWAARTVVEGADFSAAEPTERPLDPTLSDLLASVAAVRRQHSTAAHRQRQAIQQR